MSIVNQLSATADKIAAALARIRDEKLRIPLAGIRASCDAAKRAWSGSNLGYHASIYYAGLQPPPPPVQFSPEWGLMDRWPTHQPDSGW